MKPQNDEDATTFFALANLDTSLSGRFSVGGTVSGSKPSVDYPAASGPWNDPVRVPDEPSLGVEIDRLDNVTGETFEIANASPTQSPVEDDALMAGQAPSLSQSGDVETPAIPPSASSGISFLCPKDAVEGRATTSANQGDAGVVGPADELAELVSRLVVRNER